MRRRAEGHAANTAADRPDTLSPEEARSRAGTGTTTQALHELRVHQIELEIQNEELRRAQVELDAARGVQVEVTQEPVLLYGDRPRLVAVFQNLLDNAVKFMGDQPSPRVVIGVESGADDMVFFVRDNGASCKTIKMPSLRRRPESRSP